MSSLTTSRSSASPTALATASVLRPLATTACPAASAALAMSTPMPRPAPVMNQTFLSIMCSTSFVVHEIDSEPRARLAGPEPDPSGPAEPSRLDFLFSQARLVFASVVAYSRFNSTLLLLQGAESIGAYTWRFDDGSPLFTELPRRLILGNPYPYARILIRT